MSKMSRTSPAGDAGYISDDTDYEDIEENNIPDEDSGEALLEMSKEVVKEEQVEILPEVKSEPVQEEVVTYNASKYYNKRKQKQVVETFDQGQKSKHPRQDARTTMSNATGSSSQSSEIKVEVGGNGTMSDEASLEYAEFKREPQCVVKLESSNNQHRLVKSESGASQQSIASLPASSVEVKMEMSLKEPTESTVTHSTTGKGDTATNCDIKPEPKVEGSSELSLAGQLKLQKMSAIRDWEKTKFGQDVEDGTKTIFGITQGFRILSYNTLSSRHLTKQKHLFRGKPSFCLSWQYRFRHIKREIDSLDPDIVCLQEVEFVPNTDDLIADWTEYFTAKGFEWRAKRRTGDKRSDGCAVFFRTDKFMLDTWSPVEYQREGVRNLERNNVGIVCRLQTKERRIYSRLVVATTHLSYGDCAFIQRLAQISVLLAEVDKMAYKDLFNYHPVILAADLNMEPFTDIYRLLTKGDLTYSGLAYKNTRYPGSLFPPFFKLTDSLQWEKQLLQRTTPNNVGYRSGRLTHRLGFRSVHQFRQERNVYKGYAPPPAEVTTYQGGWKTVDYIFYSTVPADGDYYSADGKKEKNLKLMARLKLPVFSDLANLGGLPSTICPSDHLPLAADFILS